MRLFLLPISTKRSLIYCQRLNKILSNELTYADKLTTRANGIWAKWERSDKGWQKSVTSFGDKLFQRIPFEEWGLKSIPPLSARRKDQELQGNNQVEVTFAPSLTKSESVLDTLRNLATERKALHTKWMWGSIAIMPLTIPFGLIPIVPNLPFFYLVFRAWSHWRALSGSKHLEFLLKNNLIKLSPSWMLDATYGAANTEASAEGPDEKSGTLTTSPIDKPDHHAPKSRSEETMLLNPNDGKLIAEILTLPEVEVEIERAIRQIDKSLAAEQELKEEARDLDSAVKETKSKR